MTIDEVKKNVTSFYNTRYRVNKKDGGIEILYMWRLADETILFKYPKRGSEPKPLNDTNADLMDWKSIEEITLA